MQVAVHAYVASLSACTKNGICKFVVNENSSKADFTCDSVLAPWSTGVPISFLLPKCLVSCRLYSYVFVASLLGDCTHKDAQINRGRGRG